MDASGRSNGISISTGAGADIVTAGAGVDSISTGAGIDTINFASANFTSADTVAGGTETDAIHITDSATVVDADFTLVTGVETLVLDDDSTQSVTLAALSDAAGLVTVDATAAVTGTSNITVDASGRSNGISISTGAGADIVTAGAGVDSISTGAGNDTITGGAGADTIDGGDGTGDIIAETRNTNFTLTNNSLIIDAEGTDTLANIEVANLTGGAASNSFDIGGWTGNGSITGGGGTDTLIGPNVPNTWNITGSNVGNINGAISFADIANLTGGTDADAFTLSGGTISGTIAGGGGAGANSLTGDNVANTWVVNGAGAGNVTGVGSFSDMDTLNGGTLVDTFNIQVSSSPLSINAGTGNDVFNVSSDAPANSGNVNSISALLTLNGDGGTDTINVSDAGDGTSNTGTLTGTQLTGLGMTGGITYGTVETLNITLGSGSDTFNTQGTSAVTTLNMGSGNDTINIGNGTNSLDNIAGAFTVNGQAHTVADILNVNDQGDAGAKTYTLTSTTIDRTGAAQITYGTIETLNLNAGSDGDTINISGGTNDTAINAGGGADTVNIAGSFTIANELAIDSETISNAGGFTITASQLSIANASAIGAAGFPINSTIATLEITGSSGNAYIDETNLIDLSTINMGAGTLTLNAGGAISDSGVITAGLLTTSSVGGTVLDILHSITSFNATNIVSGNVVLNDGGGVNITGISNPVGNVTLTNTGAITDSGAISGNTLTTTSAGGTVLDFGHSVTNFNATNTGSGNVALNDDGGVNITGISNPVGNLTLTNTGTITDSGTILVGGTTTIANPGNNVILDFANNNFTGAVSVSGAVVTLVDTSSIDLGASNVTGAYSVTVTAGDITNSGALIITPGDATFTAPGGRSITLTNVGNNFGGAVNFVSTGTLANVSILDTTLLTLQALTVSNNLMSTAAGLNQSGKLVVPNTATFTSTGANDITLTTVTNNFSTAVVTSGRNATLVDANAVVLGAHNVTGNLDWTAGGAVTQSAALNVGGTTSIISTGNPVTLDNVSNDFVGAVSVTGTTVDLTDANALLLDNVTGTSTVNITAATVNEGIFGGGTSGTIYAETTGLSDPPTANVSNLTLWLSAKDALDRSGILKRGALLTTAPPTENINSEGSVQIIGLANYGGGTFQRALQAIQSESASVVSQQIIEELLEDASKADFFMEPPLLVNIDVENIGLMEEIEEDCKKDPQTGKCMPGEPGPQSKIDLPKLRNYSTRPTLLFDGNDGSILPGLRFSVLGSEEVLRVQG
ncbi:MAG: hypothetical protein AB1427_14330 [Thermodesulfobacteriota bacterium]